MKLIIETDASPEIVDEFIRSALKDGHIGTGWSSPMINAMIPVSSITCATPTEPDSTTGKETHSLYFETQ